MGTLIEFPVGLRLDRDLDRAGQVRQDEPGTVIILPVVRVERSPDGPSDGLESGAPTTPGRRRRRRS